MSKRNLLDSLEIKTPCDADWNEMSGTDDARFCGHCAKTVHDLSAVTRREAKKIIAASNGRLCVRYVRRPDGRMQTAAPLPVKIAPRAARLAAGVFGATLTLASAGAVYAQGGIDVSEVRPNNVAVSRKKSEKPPDGGAAGNLTVTIVDPNDAVIVGSQVTLTNAKTGEKFMLATDDTGAARFVAVPHGRYELSVVGLPGFSPFANRFVEIQSAIEPDIKITLEIAGALMGVVAVADWYELPLVRAAAQADAHTARRLISEGADARAKDPSANGGTALHAAVEAGSAEIARLLLDAGAKINARNKAKQTPLLMIDADANAELVRLLIERGANLNAQSETGETALMRAAYDDKIEIVKILLESGADPNLKNADGDTALSEATDEDIEKLLISYGARE